MIVHDLPLDPTPGHRTTLAQLRERLQRAHGRPELTLPGIELWQDTLVVDLKTAERARLVTSWRLDLCRGRRLTSQCFIELDYVLPGPLHRKSDLPDIVEMVLVEGEENALCLGLGEVSTASLDRGQLEASYVLLEQIPWPLSGDINGPSVDGLWLARQLRQGRPQLPLALAREWLSFDSTPPSHPLPTAPEEVRLWHRFFAQLAIQSHYPWGSWTACWAPGEVGYFLEDCQGVARVGVASDGAVWGQALEPNLEEPVRLADTVEMFMLQFVIEGLVEGRGGFFLDCAQQHADALRLEELPIGRWLRWQDEDEVRFIAGDGLLGVAKGDVVSLRANGPEVIERVMSGLATGAPP